LIIKGQEARVLYHTPDNVLSTPINKLRQGNKYQAVMTFDLQGTAFFITGGDHICILV